MKVQVNGGLTMVYADVTAQKNITKGNKAALLDVWKLVYK
jgi:hypothetical protein